MALSVDVGYCSRPKPGEVENGDAPVLRRDGAWVLFGVIDALGHGPAAADAARHALAFLARTPLERGIAAVVQGLHGVLNHTRGIGAMLCLFDGAKLQGAGVGNVMLRCQGTPVSVMLTTGILGHRLHRLRTFEGALAAGDRLVVYSDGVVWRAGLSDHLALAPQAASEALVRHAARSNDDATVLVAAVR